MFIFLFSLLNMIPLLKNTCYTNYLFVLTFLISLIILIILLLNINVKIKLIIISIILVLYKNNFILFNSYFLALVEYGYINKVENRIDNDILRNRYYNIFNSLFRLKLNFKKLPDKPSIIVCNYCSDRFENLALILIPKNVVVLIRDMVIKISKLDKLLKWVIEIKNENSYENTKREIVKHINEGRSVICYVTKDPHYGPNHIRGMRSGIFKISKELNIPITPVAIDYIDNDFGIIKYQNFCMEAGNTFNVYDVKETMFNTRIFFKNSIDKFIKNKYKGII